MPSRTRIAARAWPALSAVAAAACAADHVPVAPHPAAAEAPPVGAAEEAAPGAVYTMSNEPAGNRLVVLRRGTDGLLTPAGTYETGGLGSGAFEDSDNGLVLGDARGEAAPNNLTEARQLLFATNAGSNTLTTFRVTGDGTTLERAAVVPSGGRRPVSVTVSRGLVYVLNSGERILGLSVLNCTTGDLPTVTGFRVAADGGLTPIPGSTRPLSGQRRSGCAQASFTADGRFLVVTERLARLPGQAADDEGAIVVFPVNGDGTLGTPRVADATGRGPFGFTPTRDGHLLVSEQFGGPAGPGGGAAAAYRVNADATLTATSGSVFNGGTDTCWLVVTDDGAHAYASSFFGAGRISTYRVGPGGALTLVAAVDDGGNAGTGASDLSLSATSRYLYQLNSVTGRVHAYRAGADGRLAFLQAVPAHAPSPGAARLGLAAF